MASYADKETQKLLIDASNFVCEHISKRLPAGWEIVFQHSDGSASISSLTERFQ